MIAGLDDDLLLFPNHLLNIVILREGEEDNSYLGMIDFNAEDIEWWIGDGDEG